MRNQHVITLFAASALLASGLATDACSAEKHLRSIPGPVPARVVRIIDGDTVLVDAHPWPGHAVRVSVRVRGIDAPEGRSPCQAERLAAHQARDELERLISAVSVISLMNVSGGKYYGRVLADLRAGDRDVAGAMLSSGLAKPYQGGKRPAGRCTDPGP